MAVNIEKIMKNQENLFWKVPLPVGYLDRQTSLPTSDYRSEYRLPYDVS